MNRQVADEKVNVHNAVAIGNNMAAEFKRFVYPCQGSHNGDYNKGVKHVKIGEISVYDMQHFYGR